MTEDQAVSHQMVRIRRRWAQLGEGRPSLAIEAELERALRETFLAGKVVGRHDEAEETDRKIVEGEL